jgi:hypothetical protein
VSRHTWLTKPTAAKAAILLDAFVAAMKTDPEDGFNGERVVCFAGYFLEMVRQRGAGRRSYNWVDPYTGRKVSDAGTQLGPVLTAAVRGGHRYAKGKNADNYTTAFYRHALMMVHLLVVKTAPAVGLEPNTPPEMVADRLEDLDRLPEAEAIRALLELA